MCFKMPLTEDKAVHLWNVCLIQIPPQLQLSWCWFGRIQRSAVGAKAAGGEAAQAAGVEGDGCRGGLYTAASEFRRKKHDL